MLGVLEIPNDFIRHFPGFDFDNNRLQSRSRIDGLLEKIRTSSLWKQCHFFRGEYEVFASQIQSEHPQVFPLLLQTPQDLLEKIMKGREQGISEIQKISEIKDVLTSARYIHNIFKNIIKIIRENQLRREHILALVEAAYADLSSGGHKENRDMIEPLENISHQLKESSVPIDIIFWKELLQANESYPFSSFLQHHLEPFSQNIETYQRLSSHNMVGGSEFSLWQEKQRNHEEDPFVEMGHFLGDFGIFDRHHYYCRKLLGLDSLLPVKINFSLGEKSRENKYLIEILYYLIRAIHESEIEFQLDRLREYSDDKNYNPFLPLSHTEQEDLKEYALMLRQNFYDFWNMLTEQIDYILCSYNLDASNVKDIRQKVKRYQLYLMGGNEWGCVGGYPAMREKIFHLKDDTETLKSICLVPYSGGMDF